MGGAARREKVSWWHVHELQELQQDIVLEPCAWTRFKVCTAVAFITCCCLPAAAFYCLLPPAAAAAVAGANIWPKEKIFVTVSVALFGACEGYGRESPAEGWNVYVSRGWNDIFYSTRNHWVDRKTTFLRAVHDLHAHRASHNLGSGKQGASISLHHI